MIGNPKVTILIPNKDGIDILDNCLNSILNQTTYTNYEIVIIENNSEKQETFEYYKKIEQNEKVKVIFYDKKGGTKSRPSEVLQSTCRLQTHSYCNKDNTPCVDWFA